MDQAEQSNATLAPILYAAFKKHDRANDEVGDAFAEKTGFDPRQLSDPYLYFCIDPRRI